MSLIVVDLIVAAGFGLVIGLALGLTGGGGSIFAMPMLIYGLGMPPAQAVPISLAAVGMTALVGGLHAIRARLIVWPAAILFAVGGVLGAPGGLAVAQLLDARWIVGGFAVLALTIGLLMWRRAIGKPEQATAVRADGDGGGRQTICALSPDGRLSFSAPCALVLAAVGLLTGFLSGLFGVGGGFLIVPALMLVTRMGVHAAVGTSLLIISAIGVSGAGSALVRGQMDWTILLPFVGGGAIAMLAARRFAGRVAGPTLQKIFAGLIVLVGIVMLIDGLLSSIAS